MQQNARQYLFFSIYFSIVIACVILLLFLWVAVAAPFTRWKSTRRPRAVFGHFDQRGPAGDARGVLRRDAHLQKVHVAREEDRARVVFFLAEAFGGGRGAAQVPEDHGQPRRTPWHLLGPCGGAQPYKGRRGTALDHRQSSTRPRGSIGAFFHGRRRLLSRRRLNASGRFVGVLAGSGRDRPCGTCLWVGGYAVARKLGLGPLRNALVEVKELLLDAETAARRNPPPLKLLRRAPRAGCQTRVTTPALAAVADGEDSRAAAAAAALLSFGLLVFFF